MLKVLSRTADGGEEKLISNLSSPVLPFLACITFSYSVAGVMLNVYKTSVDSILLCFCSDMITNKESGESSEHSRTLLNDSGRYTAYACCMSCVGRCHAYALPLLAACHVSGAAYALPLLAACHVSGAHSLSFFLLAGFVSMQASMQ
jgi:hypothetical protein